MGSSGEDTLFVSQRPMDLDLDLDLNLEVPNAPSKAADDALGGEDARAAAQRRRKREGDDPTRESDEEWATGDLGPAAAGGADEVLAGSRQRRVKRALFAADDETEMPAATFRQWLVSLSLISFFPPKKQFEIFSLSLIPLVSLMS